jgi:hypothetical protein
VATWTSAQARWSFRWKFHLGLLGPMGAHWPDDPSDVSSKDRRSRPSCWSRSTGERRDGRSRTIGELVQRWLAWRQDRPISPVTVASYRGAIDRYITPNLGRATVHEVDAATLDTLYARVRATGGKSRVCWKRIPPR